MRRETHLDISSPDLSPHEVARVASANALSQAHGLQIRLRGTAAASGVGRRFTATREARRAVQIPHLSEDFRARTGRGESCLTVLPSNDRALR